MMTMEFEELQKIWDTQNNRPLYAIDEKALHNRILFKKRQAGRVTNFSELLLIIVNAGAGIFILVSNVFSADPSLSLYGLAAWMFCCALYVLVIRTRRTMTDNQFDRSIQEDLDQTISMADDQVRLSQLTRWNMLPVGILLVLGVWEGGKSVWVTVGVLVFFALAYFAGSWEHSIYKSRKRELEMLNSRLRSEEQADCLS